MWSSTYATYPRPSLPSWAVSLCEMLRILGTKKWPRGRCNGSTRLMWLLGLRSRPRLQLVQPPSPPRRICAGEASTRGKLFFGGAEDIGVRLSGAGGDRRAAPLALRDCALHAYQQAQRPTRRTPWPWAGYGHGSHLRRIHSLLEMDQTGCPEVRPRGAIHAVLPTKPALPSPSVQAAGCCRWIGRRCSP